MSKRAFPRPGQTVWLFDQNHRVYDNPRDWSNRRIIYAEHWIETTVVKAGPKNLTLATRAVLQWDDHAGVYRTSTEHVAFTRDEVDADIWRANNRHRLTNMVGECKDVAVLKQIAALVGYTEV